MKMYALISSILVIIIFSGCTIKQEIKPVKNMDNNKTLCIIENPPVREGFLDTMQENLLSKGYNIKIIQNNQTKYDCPIEITYIGKWSWDLAIYLAYANIKVYKNNNLIGEANYDSTKASMTFSKFVNGNDKINELLDLLFPYNN